MITMNTRQLDDRLLILESCERKRRIEGYWRMTRERIIARQGMPITCRDIVISKSSFLELIIENSGESLLVAPLLQSLKEGFCVELPYLFGWGFLVARLDITHWKWREDVSDVRVDVMLEYQFDIVKAFLRAVE